MQKALRLPNVASRDYVLEPMPHSVSTPKDGERVCGWPSSEGSRADVRRKKRKLIREFGSGARIQCFREPAELDSAILLVEAIAKTTYQRALDVGISRY